MKLIIVRHGETVWNEEDRIQSHHHNSPFTNRGHRQNKKLIKKLSKEKIDVIYTSCLSRCIRTVEIILEGKGDVTMVLEPRINQKGWGILEGMTRGEIGEQYPDSGYGDDGRTINKEKKYMFRPPGGGETWCEVEKRLHDFLVDIFQKHKDDETVLVVTHAAISRSVLSQLTGIHVWNIHPEIKRTNTNTFMVKKNVDGTYLILNPTLMLRYKHRLHNTFTP